MSSAIKRALLHFATRSTPKFGRGKKFTYDDAKPPKSVTNSPYYWWFKFLQLSEDYKATVKAQGAGRCADLYADFGDILATDFKTWWQAHAHLFAEPYKGYSMKVAMSATELAPFGSKEVINLVVPLTWNQRSLKKRFAELVLNKVEKGGRGVSIEASEAKYQLSGKWRVDAMSTAYRVYMLRTQHADATDFARTDENTGRKKALKRYALPWADVAIRAKIVSTIGLKEGVKTQQTSDERRTATILAMRHYKRAVAYIEAAASTSFPYR